MPLVNSLLVLFHLSVGLAVLFLWPIWLLPESPWMALALLPLLILSQPNWSLIHEATHGHLFKRRWLNDTAARALTIVRFAAPYDPQARGHLLHHKYNPPQGYQMNSDRQSNRPTLRWLASLVSQPYTLVGLTSFIVWLPTATAKRILPSQQHKDIIDFLCQRGLLPRVRLDAAMAIVIWGSALLLYGPMWWVLLLFLLSQMAWLSFLDGMYHYQPDPWTWEQGYNLKLSAPLQMLALNFNLHGVHHSNLSLAWHELPAAFKEQNRQYHGNYLTAALNQLRGTRAMPGEVANELLACPKWSEQEKNRLRSIMNLESAPDASQGA